MPISSSHANGLASKVVRKLHDLGLSVILPVEVHTYDSAGMVALHLKPGKGQKVAGILAVAEDIQTAAGVTARVCVDHNAGAVVVELPVAKPPVLYLSKLMAKAEPYNMTLGKRVEGSQLKIDIGNPATPHVLVAGTTGAGKSALVQTMLATICHASPMLRVVVYDPIHLGLPAIMPMIKGKLWEAVSEPAKMVAWLKKLHEGMQRGWVAENRVLVVIDELADLIRVEPAIVNTLIALAQRGRNSKIHLLLATQNPSAKVLTSDLVQCMPVRVVLSVVREVDSRQASGDQKIDAHKLPKPGHGIMCNGGEVVRFVAAMPDQYATAQVRGFADGPQDGPAQEPLPFTVSKAAPNRAAVQMQRDFGLPAIASPKGESVAVLVAEAVAEPVREPMANALQTIEAEPQVAAMVRPADSYTLKEIIALIMAFNPDVSVSALQNALRPGGAQNGFRAVTEIVNELKANRGEN